MVSTLQACHQRGVICRDLKPGNLLSDAEINIKLLDFGLSNECKESGKLDTFCGSPAYAAPELFLGQSYDSPAMDVWSLGILLYSMVTRSLSFGGWDFWEL